MNVWLAHLHATKIFKKNSDILFTLKAFNGRVVLEWLCAEILQFCQADGCDNLDPRVYHIATAANLLYNYGVHVYFFQVCNVCMHTKMKYMASNIAICTCIYYRAYKW